ncbi:MAG: HTH domain-containing protein [Candidatus Sulfotelmatobacter sp.]
MKNKSRGNPTSGAERAARQKKALELMKTGATQGAIAELLGVSRVTFWRDLQAIEARYVEGSKEDVAAFKKSQYDALMRIESATAEGTIEPEVANALVRVRDSVARLLGLNAPSRSISANVNVDGENIGPYRKFVLAVAGLDESQVEQLLLMAREMPRKPFVMVQPPKTSPLWTNNQLTEGDDASA